MNLKDAAANLNQAHPEDILHPLYTLWGESLVRSGSYDDILPEYPRPQMKRTDYHMLHSQWRLPSFFLRHHRICKRRSGISLCKSPGSD